MRKMYGSGLDNRNDCTATKCTATLLVAGNGGVLVGLELGQVAAQRTMLNPTIRGKLDVISSKNMTLKT